jgi:hypothetical protein
LRRRQHTHTGAAATQGNVAGRKDVAFLVLVALPVGGEPGIETRPDFDGTFAHSLDAVSR